MRRIPSISERAMEYAEKSFPSDDISNYGKHDVAFHSYIAGAKWMLEKVMNLISEVSDRSGRPVDAEEFRKAMEE